MDRNYGITYGPFTEELNLALLRAEDGWWEQEAAVSLADAIGENRENPPIKFKPLFEWLDAAFPHAAQAKTPIWATVILTGYAEEEYGADWHDCNIQHLDIGGIQPDPNIEALFIEACEAIINERWNLLSDQYNYDDQGNYD